MQKRYKFEGARNINYLFIAQLILLAVITFVSSRVIINNALADEVNLAEKLSGQILINTENDGELWYVDPTTNKRLYLDSADFAYTLLRSRAISTSAQSINGLPMGLLNVTDTDTDSDGISDRLEKIIGGNVYSVDTDNDGFDDKNEVLSNYNLNGSGKKMLDSTLIDSFRGYFILNVDDSDSVWYISPRDSRRYFIGGPLDFSAVVKQLAIGINLQDLGEIESEE
ncbi:hypothetical protein ISS03_00645 [Patescibacteria group bacterium]|nr:hypothetical protein [Patescibacteria group bacterium]